MSTPDNSEILVATYVPQQVAEAVGLQQKVMQGMAGLQQRAQQAQQEGDQQTLQQIQAEAQKIERDVTIEFLAEVDAVLPKVAEAAGASIVAIGVSYAVSGVATQDVTPAVIQALQSPIIQ